MEGFRLIKTQSSTLAMTMSQLGIVIMGTSLSKELQFLG